MRRVLIIKMSALGDIFLSLPHIEAILTHHKKDQVWILTSPPFERIFINHPELRVVVLDRKKLFGINSGCARVLWVRKQNFSAIYDLQGNRTSRNLIRFSNSPARIGILAGSVYNYHPEFLDVQNSRRNVFELLNEILISAGLPEAVPGSTIYPYPEDINRVKEWKQKKGLQDGNYVIMHAGCSAAWPSKRWPKEYFLELAVLIEKTGIRCVFAGGSEDKEINSDLAKKAGINSTGEFNILQLYLIGKGARFAIVNDSGPMHILAASGIPVYSFFGPTDWMRSHPFGQGERVFNRDIKCSPCFRRVCPKEKAHACLREITPELVFNTVYNPAPPQTGVHHLKR